MNDVVEFPLLVKINLAPAVREAILYLGNNEVEAGYMILQRHLRELKDYRPLTNAPTDDQLMENIAFFAEESASEVDGERHFMKRLVILKVPSQFRKRANYCFKEMVRLDFFRKVEQDTSNPGRPKQIYSITPDEISDPKPKQTVEEQLEERISEVITVFPTDDIPVL